MASPDDVLGRELEKARRSLEREERALDEHYRKYLRELNRACEQNDRELDRATKGFETMPAPRRRSVLQGGRRLKDGLAKIAQAAAKARERARADHLRGRSTYGKLLEQLHREAKAGGDPALLRVVAKEGERVRRERVPAVDKDYDDFAVFLRRKDRELESYLKELDRMSRGMEAAKGRPSGGP
jgi:hypothetical protein